MTPFQKIKELWWELFGSLWKMNYIFSSDNFNFTFLSCLYFSMFSILVWWNNWTSAWIEKIVLTFWFKRCVKFNIFVSTVCNKCVMSLMTIFYFFFFVWKVQIFVRIRYFVIFYVFLYCSYFDFVTNLF